MSLLCLNFVSQKMTESTLAAEFVPKAEWITEVYTKIPSKSTRVGRVVRAGTQSRISVARNEVQFREGEAPAEPRVSAVQWLGRSLALPG